MEDDAGLVLVQTRDRRLYKVATDEPELMLLPWQPEGTDQAPMPAADLDMDFGCAVSDDEGEDEAEEGKLEHAGAGCTAAFQLPALCERLVHLSLGPSHARQSAVIGLTARHELLVNGVTLATDCNSVAVHDAFVVCCSVQHVLCLLDRRTAPESLQYRTTKRHAYDHAVRAVERGSRIVALPRQGTGVVLQMPRGNLEAVVPRPLVLHRCYTLLDAGHYGRACALLRKHRLSLNVLCDYKPDVFEQNISSFVAGVNNVDHLNLFLSELADEDVTRTMYPPLNAEVGVASLLGNLAFGVSSFFSRFFFSFFLSQFLSMLPRHFAFSIYSIKSSRKKQFCSSHLFHRRRRAHKVNVLERPTASATSSAAKCLRLTPQNT
jgi:hypothetical protein